MSPTPHVFVHYHLRPGGVTRVIRGQSRALKEGGVPNLVLSGSKSESESLPDLDYSAQVRPGLAEKLKRVAKTHFGTSQVVWHFHNPCLGKNPSLTKAVNELATQGHRMILQHHDFSEDGRSEDFRRLSSLDAIFPLGSAVHHACINQRDRSFLIHAGVPPTQCSVVHNPVAIPAIERRSSNWIFQPVRGIRRKNLGETLLLAAHAPEGVRFAISRSPDQPHSIPIHDSWRQLAEKLNLPIEFAVSGRLAPAPNEGTSFEAWLGHASHLLSTSVAEGFGMTFIEGAALGIPLIGRRLPELDPDLKHLPLRHLYSRISIPIGDAAPLNKRRADAIRLQYKAFGAPPPQTLDPLGDEVDFCELPEELQSSLIKQSRKEDLGLTISTHEQRIPLMSYLRSALETTPPPPHDLIAHSPEKVAATLKAIRHTLIEAHATAPKQLSRDRILSQFLKPSRFRFLCQ